MICRLFNYFMQIVEKMDSQRVLYGRDSTPRQESVTGYARKKVCHFPRKAMSISDALVFGLPLQRVDMIQIPHLPPKADMCGAARDVRYGPIADVFDGFPISDI